MSVKVVNVGGEFSEEVRLNVGLKDYLMISLDDDGLIHVIAYGRKGPPTIMIKPIAVNHFAIDLVKN